LEAIARDPMPPPPSAIPRPTGPVRPGRRPRLPAAGSIVLVSALIATAVLGTYFLRRSESTSGQAGAGRGAGTADTLPRKTAPAVPAKEPGGTDSASRVTLNGGGSTFIYPLIEKWGSVYIKEANVKINYLPIGSGAGVQELMSRRWTSV